MGMDETGHYCDDCGENFEGEPRGNWDVCPKCEEAQAERDLGRDDFWDRVDAAYDRIKEGW